MHQSFTETQKFRQWYIWALLAGVALIPIYGLYTQLYLGVPMGNNPLSNTGMIFFALFIALLLLLFFIMRLETTINNTHIHFRFFPFVNKSVSWDDVKTAEIIDYGFVGGWGIRIGTPYGTVYNISGRKGLALELNNGRKFLIGTRKTAELELFLNRLVREESH